MKKELDKINLQEVIKEELYSLLEEAGVDPSSIPDIENKAIEAMSKGSLDNKESKDVSSNEGDGDEEGGSLEKEKKKKKIKVTFDKNTSNPFVVIFSERGFDVEGTRMSFEILHYALSKDFHITLDGGRGLELTPVKMQKILKYEDRF